MKLSVKDVQTDLHRRAVILLNGIQQTHVLEASEEEGYVERFKLKGGKPYVEGEEVATETVYGEVVILDPHKCEGALN